MRYLGDFVEDDTVVACFNTRQADGTPITLGGTPAVSVYKDGGTTESTAGVTLTVDFDSRTGLHLVAVDTSADAFYATGSDYSIVVTTGTVDSVSVVGTEVASFSIENRYTAAGGSGLDAAGVRAAVGLASANLDTQLSGVPAAVEAAILNEGDATALLAAIAAKVEEFLINEGDATATIAAIATACNAAIVAGTVGSNVTAILADTNELQSDLANGGRLDLLVDAILEDTGTTLPGLITTGPVYLPSVVQASVGASESTIEIIQGDYGYTYSVAVTDAAGDAVNLTSTGTLTFIVESTADAADVATYTATGTSTGFTWVPTSAVSLTAGSYRWALKEALTGPTGVRTWAYGTFDVITAAVVDA